MAKLSLEIQSNFNTLIDRLLSIVDEANAPERLVAIACLMEDLEERSPLKLTWVDAGYSGENFARVVASVCGTRRFTL